MVVGGYTRNYQMTSNVEVLSLNLETSSVPECMRFISEFPSTLALASGGLTQDGRPFVCGGYYDLELTNKCFVHHPNDSWVESGTTNITRSWVGADYSAEFGGLVIAGGHDLASEGPTDVVEFTADGENFEALVPLQIANIGLCLVITGNDSLFIAGGQTEDGEVVSHAYTYTMGDTSWTQITDMGSRSKYHKCGLIDVQEGREVVVTGFMIPNRFGSLVQSQIVEIYNLASGIWRSARTINFKPMYSSTFSYGNSFALVGGWYMGEDVNVWTYDESNGIWYGLTNRIEGTSSKTGLSTVIPVNEDMFNSCQCGTNEFSCVTDGQCHPQDVKCNGELDCEDGSDEDYIRCG